LIAALFDSVALVVNYEGKICGVGLYTELFYAIIPTLFLCFLLMTMVFLTLSPGGLCVCYCYFTLLVSIKDLFDC